MNAYNHKRDPLQTTILSRDHILGRDAISHLRFSTPDQERGSSIDRQEHTLTRLVSVYQLNRLRSVEDRGLSGQGCHRERGELGILLEMIDNGEVKPGTILIIEAWDRLTREPTMAVMAMLQKLFARGIIILEGADENDDDPTDMIWNEATVNADSEKLIARIKAARRYVQRLSNQARGAHKARREKLAKLRKDPKAEVPVINSPPPAWITRSKRSNDYGLHPERAPVVALIFELCIQGLSVRAIAKHLNDHHKPTFPNGKNPAERWAAPRVAAILRSRAVIGQMRPCVRVGTRREKAGEWVTVYPAAIPIEMWVQARLALHKRREGLVGRRGGEVPNLFPKKLFCKSCGESLRVDTSGSLLKDGRRRRMLTCARYVEARSCSDKDRYDLYYYEPRLLHLLALHLPISKPQLNATEIAEEIDSLVRREQDASENLEALRPRIGKSLTMADEFEKTAREIDRYKAQRAELELQLEAAKAPSRAEEMLSIMHRLIEPAERGDIDAREQLRSLLSRVEFRITTASDGLILFINGQTFKIPAGQDGDARPAYVRMPDDSVWPATAPDGTLLEFAKRGEESA
jgi:DNA invertase Pin-like site-specific DNA recombinase